MLNNLGNRLLDQFRRTKNNQDFDAATTTHFASWKIIPAPPLHRINAALQAAKCLVFLSLFKKIKRACSLLRGAVHLMPLVTSRSLGREDHQHILEKLMGLASLATSVSLEAGESPMEALRLLELGRSVTNGQLLDYRSDISHLEECYPTLAKDFDTLRQEMDSPCPAFQSSGIPTEEYLRAQQSTIRRRNKVAEELNQVLLQIRRKPGFLNFLCADSEAYLLSAAHEGPIVVLNITRLRSDAILVTKDKVTSICLPELSHASLNRYCGTEARTLDNRVQRELLEWLWKAAVQPVLKKLGFYVHPMPKKGDPLPRIWWIGVGLMSKAPIHAAAKFKNGRVQRTTLHYCIPSYTSTIR